MLVTLVTGTTAQVSQLINSCSLFLTTWEKKLGYDLQPDQRLKISDKDVFAFVMTFSLGLGEQVVRLRAP